MFILLSVPILIVEVETALIQPDWENAPSLKFSAKAFDEVLGVYLLQTLQLSPPSISLKIKNSIDDYQKLLRLNNIIEKKFHKDNKKINEETKNRINKILTKKNEK